MAMKFTFLFLIVPKGGGLFVGLGNIPTIFLLLPLLINKGVIDPSMYQTWN